MLANSQVDIAVIANLLNLNIWTFTYNRSNGHTPVWNTSSPDPELSLYTHYSHRPTLDVALYHSEDCHYDLLVRPDSPLVHIAARQHLEVVEQSQSQSQQEIEPPLEPEVLPDLSVDDVITEGITALRSILEDKNLQKISPLNFPPCPWGPGIPKIRKVRERAPSIPSKKRKNPDTGFSFVPECLREYRTEEPPKKKRSHPVGSKNKN